MKRLLRFLNLMVCSLLLASCSNTPDQPIQLEYSFWLNPTAGDKAQFRITYFRPPANWFKKNRHNEDPLLDDHLLYIHLEQELDQRQLCLDGYRILERRNTAKGRTFSGECQ